MKLTSKGRYAVMALVDLARFDNIIPVSLRDISLRQGISLDYLEQIFSKLRKKEIVQSVRGTQGGYVLNRKAKDIKLIKIDKVSFISEWILIAEGLSDVQVRSITNSVEGELREKAKIEPPRKEGINEAKWALLDYGDLIINIFQPEIRKFYDLESYWSNGDNLTFP